MRLINSSSMSAYHIALGDLDGELITVDGFAVAPIRGRSFPIAVAQRLDIRVALPRGPGAYPALAVLEGERNRPGSCWSLETDRSPASRTKPTLLRRR